MRLLPIVLAFSLAGCAIGNRYDYQSVRASIPTAKKKATVAIATVDRREYLTKSEVAENYVGMTRGGYGNPFRVSTKSGAPLAMDISNAVASSLNQSGYQAQALSGFPVQDVASAKSKLFSTPTNRRILITLIKWESDTLVNTELTTDITVEVFDQSGRLLASESYTATKGLGGNLLNPILHARKSILDETSKIIARIFSTPQITTAL